jgi:pSer/pThr/pTyr-binding forkhead associated (FHA) protein
MGSRSPSEDTDDGDLPSYPRRPTDSRAATDGTGERTGKSYRTGKDYPGDETEATGPTPSAISQMGRDIYGENDPLPDEEWASGTNVGELANSEVTRAGPPCKLVILAGPDRGKVYRFKGVRMVVGRTQGCAVWLSDPSVSRRHLELVVASEGILLRDLGSGNGTRVNGQPLTEGPLKHLDVIQIGQTQLQFVDEAVARKSMRQTGQNNEAPPAQAEPAAAAAEPAQEAEPPKEEKEAAAPAEGAQEASTDNEEPFPEERERTALSAAKIEAKRAFKGLSKRQKMVVGAAVTAWVLLFFLFAPLLFRRADSPPPHPREVAAQKKLEEAQRMLGEGKPDEALDLLESAERLRPGLAGVTGERIRKEVAVVKALENARTALKQARFEDAWAALAEVPSDLEPYNREKKLLESEVEAKQLQHLELSADEALARLDIAAAKEAMAKLPEEKQAAFAPRLEQAEIDAREKEQRERDEVLAAEEAARQQAEAVRVAQLESVFRAVERKFQARDFERAVLECDRILEQRNDAPVLERAKQLKRLIPLFVLNLEDGERKLQNGANETAVQSLKKAKGMYDEINLPGPLGQIMDEYLLQASIAGGKAALARNDLASAATLFSDALKMSPEEAEAKKGMKRLSQRADDLYYEGYVQRDREPKEAAAKFKLVMELAPKTSPIFEKAQEQLQKLPH